MSMTNTPASIVDNSSPQPTIHVALIGHVDHGKSTLAGRMLNELKLVSDETITEYREQAILLGKPTFEYAWVMDVVMQERQRGLTIEPSYRPLTISNKRIVLVDGPGHHLFAKNTILAISASDCVVLVVAADDGIKAQTEEHVVISRAFGISEVVVVVNKMDKAYPPFSEERFQELTQDLQNLLARYGFDSRQPLVVPAAAYFGENITKASSQMPWYDGPTVLQAMAQLELQESYIEAPFRMAVDRAFPVRGVGQVVTGRIGSGTIKKGESCIIVPGNSISRVRSIETFGSAVLSANAGDDVGLGLGGLKGDIVERGSLIGSVDHPPVIAKTILARLAVVESGHGITVGRTPLLFAHSARTVANIVGIVSRVSATTDEVLERKPSSLGVSETGYVEIELQAPIPIEIYDNLPRYSRLILREQDHTVAMGSCIQVLEP